MAETILILGGGIGGPVAANALQRRLSGEAPHHPLIEKNALPAAPAGSPPNRSLERVLRDGVANL